MKLNSNNDFFKFTQDSRKFLTKWLIIINPAIVAIIVLVFNIDIVSKLVAVFSSETSNELQKSPRVSVTMNTVVFTVIANILVNIFKTPGEIKVKITNNSRKNNHHFSSDALHRSYPIHLDGSVEFKNILLKWVLFKFISLKIQISIPKWVDFDIVNIASISDYIDENASRRHFISVNKLFEEVNSNKKDFYIHYSLNANSPHQNNDSINITLIASKKVLILVALFFDTKLEEYNIELREE